MFYYLFYIRTLVRRYRRQTMAKKVKLTEIKVASEALPSNGHNPEQDARLKTLQRTLDDIMKRYGEGAIMRLGEAALRMTVEAVSTGSISLDLALGVGGIPRGRVTEIYGPESSGKTTLCQHLVAETQKRGGT